MSHVAFDQLLQVTAPARPSQGALPQDEAAGNRFRSHLERASSVPDSKSTETTERPDPLEPDPLEEEQPLESQTDQQQASTTQQEESTTVEESSEPASEAAETEDQPEDEVTLSEAATVTNVVVPETEIAASTELAPTEEVAAEVSTSDDQQQTQQQPTVELVESKTGGAGIEGATGVKAETSSKPEVLAENQATEGLDKLTTDSEAKGGSAEQGNTEEVRSPTADQKAGPAAENLSNPQKQQAEQTTDGAHPVGAELPASEKNKDAADQQAKKRESTPVANRLATSTEAERAELNSNDEASAPKPSSSTSNENPLAAERSLGRLLPARATSRGTAETEPTTPPVDRARFVQRVGGAIRTAQQRDGQIQLRLSPPELGSLRIDITVKNGVVTAKLETETAAARTVLLDNLPALRERLAEQEIRIEKFDVDVRREGQQQSENPGSEERQTNTRREESTPAQQNRQTPQLELSAAEIQNSLPTDASGLDVRI